jgi:hypothetical protein
MRETNNALKTYLKILKIKDYLEELGIDGRLLILTLKYGWCPVAGSCEHSMNLWVP